MRTRTVPLVLACVLAGLAGGLWLGGHPESLPGPLRDAFVSDEPAVRAEIIDTIRDSYYRRVNEKDLDSASFKGLVRALHDPFSQYLTPSEAKELRQSVEGRFDGVGMTVEENRRGLRVLGVFDGAPAQRAGIRPGDLITGVDGGSIAGMGTEAATGRIKGPPGTRVRLQVLKPRTGRRVSVELTRRRIEVPVARGRTVERAGTKLGVVRLVSFTSGAHGLVRREVDRLLRRGVKGLLLDLRGNGGGLLREAVLVSSTFIEDGTIVSVRGRTRANRTEDAVGDAIDRRIPLVVLVDRASASASEITAGALRDRGRATVVGTHTYGKGLVQEVEPLANGGVLELTVAKYYLPHGEPIRPHKGIAPQVKASDDPRTERDEALPVALRTLSEKIR